MLPNEIQKKYEEIQLLTENHAKKCEDKDLRVACNLLTELSPRIREYTDSTSNPFNIMSKTSAIQYQDSLILERDRQFAEDEKRLIEEYISKHTSFFNTMTGVGYAGYFGYFSMVSDTDITDEIRNVSLFFMSVSLITFAASELKKYWRVTNFLKKGHERLLAAENSIGSYQELRSKHCLERTKFFSTGETLRRIIVVFYLLSFVTLTLPILFKTLSVFFSSF